MEPAPTGRTPAAAPPRLYRATEGRALAGVARGIAEHLGVDVLWVRGAFVLLALAQGAGVFAYGAFWIFVPQDAEIGAVRPNSARSRLGNDRAEAVALSALGLGALMLVQGAGLGGGVVGPYVWPLLVVGAGVVLVWGQADAAQRERWWGRGRWRASYVVRALTGVVLVLAGGGLFLAASGDLGQAPEVLLAVLVVVGGLALLTGPWWLGMARDLAAERRERIRSQERAEVAAHVHDSVLHTLTLIQRNVDDPREVQRLARAQERELRGWLYRPQGTVDASFTASLERLAAEVEDAHGVQAEVVAVGDCPLDERLGALLQAAREAMVNAAKYAGTAALSVYGEVDRERVTVFVRDRGKGFDLATVPDDRLGVRQSILGRMDRNGGVAAVRSAPGEGTEVRLEMTRSTP